MKKRIMACAVALITFAISAMAADKPVYPGGAEALSTYITTNMQYPPEAKANGIEGVVTVIFTVKADGTIGAIKIKRMVDPDLEEEAIRLVKKMPKWTPADKNGTPVDAPAEVSVNFSLGE